MRKIILLVSFTFMRSFAHAATIDVVPSTTSAYIGDTMTVHVSVGGVADLYAFQFGLSFAPGVLRAIGVSDGMFLTSGSLLSGLTDNSIGEIVFIAKSLTGSVPGISGAGTIARIDLLVVGPGSSVVTVNKPILLDSALSDIIVAPLQPAYVTISGVDGSPVPEPGTVVLVFIATFALGAIRTRV